MTVLAYHAVGDCPRHEDPHGLVVPVEAFVAQLDFLLRRRRVVPLADLVAGAQHDRQAVAITFDDGYRSVLDIAAPLLHERGLPATVFVPTGWLGRRNGWDDLPAGPFEIMEAEDLRAAEALGVAVESHGHAHISYATTPEPEIEADLAASVAELGRILGRAPAFLAYPYGPSSPAARQAAARHGFAAAFSVDEPHAGTFAFGRVPVAPHDTLAAFQWKTAGRYLAVRHHPAVRAVRAISRPLRARLRR